MSEKITINGVMCRALTDEQTAQRRNDFVSNQEAVAGIDKLAKLIGKEEAHAYFERVYYNLKYDCTEE